MQTNSILSHQRQVQKSDIITGQYVQISQTPAGIGERMAAQLIDWLVQFAFLFFGITISSYWPSSFPNTDHVFRVILIVLTLLYCPLCEIFNHGQTLGKLLMKLRVVMKDGTTPSLGAYLLRWLLFIIDGPLLSFIGIVIIIVTRHHQRIGDLAAGTLVIRLDSYNKVRISLDEFAHLGTHYHPVYPQAADLSFDQFTLIEQTLMLPPDDPRVHQLAQKAKSTLAINQQKESSDHTFLQQLHRDGQYYMLEEI